MGVTTITIEWNEVECTDRNGDITSYSVHYGPSSTPSSSRAVKTVTGPNRILSVGGLTIHINYSFEVAASNLNRHGIGPYSIDILIVIPVPSGKYKFMIDLSLINIKFRTWILPQWSDVPQQQYCDHH